MTSTRRFRDAFYAAERRRTTLERMAEAIATTEAQWSFAERLEAARALGLADWMAEPQEEMELNQGDRDGR